MNLVLRVVAAVAALVVGWAHLSLYNDGYKDIPVGNIGTQFLLNALGGLAIAVGLLAPLVVRRLPAALWQLAAAGGIAWAAISLIAFFRARSDSGWFGFQDRPGLKPSPEAALSVYGEIIVLVACVVLLAQVALARRSTLRTN